MFQNWVTKGREREIEAFNYLICLPERGAGGGRAKCVYVRVCVRVCVGGGDYFIRSPLF